MKRVFDQFSGSNGVWLGLLVIVAGILLQGWWWWLGLLPLSFNVVNWFHGLFTFREFHLF